MIAATPRGTIFGGRLDCYVLTDGTPVVTHGRVSSLDVKELVDWLLLHCKTLEFTDREGRTVTGAVSDDFIDRLCDLCFKRQLTGRLYDLARQMLRETTMTGLREVMS
jgi:hypothetical protein